MVNTHPGATTPTLSHFISQIMVPRSFSSPFTFYHQICWTLNLNDMTCDMYEYIIKISSIYIFNCLFSKHLLSACCVQGIGKEHTQGVAVPALQERTVRGSASCLAEPTAPGSSHRTPHQIKDVRPGRSPGWPRTCGYLETTLHHETKSSSLTFCFKPGV